MKLEQILALAPVIPVVIIEDLADAVPLARALVAGGLRVIEITLRTAAGIAAIRAIAAEVPEAVVGAGTVLDASQFSAALAAGARFIVSPGATGSLLATAKETGAAYLPGIATATEAMRLIEHGYKFAKFFPAEPSGGARFLAAIASPLPQLKFCPTGGITLQTAPGYLKLPNVTCIGGSWMVRPAAIAARDWGFITKAATEAAVLQHR